RRLGWWREDGGGWRGGGGGERWDRQGVQQSSCRIRRRCCCGSHPGPPAPGLQAAPPALVECHIVGGWPNWSASDGDSVRGRGGHWEAGLHPSPSLRPPDRTAPC